MAPTNDRSTARRGNLLHTGKGNPFRNANTQAGVRRNASAAPQDVYRPRDAHCRPARLQRPQGRFHPPSRPSIDVSRDHVRIAHGDTSKHRPQGDRPCLRDRITDDRVNDAESVSVAGRRPPVAQHTQVQETSSAAVSDHESEIDIDTLLFGPSKAIGTTNELSQASALFCSSQPTQNANPPVLPPSTFFPPLRSVREATTSQPIRMINQPVIDNDAEIGARFTSKRPANTYRGKDPIKKMVQNKKLQALLSDKPIPKERKKAFQERMDLRIGQSKVTR